MTLTQSQKNTINAIIAAKTRIALDQEAVKDDLSALAAELGLKPGATAKLINLIIKEQGKGGVIREESQLLEMAEQVLGVQDAE